MKRIRLLVLRLRIALITWRLTRLARCASRLGLRAMQLIEKMERISNAA